MRSPLKIAFLDQYAHCGGGQIILLSLIREAVHAGWQVTVLIPGREELDAEVRKSCPDATISNIPPLALNHGRKNIRDIVKLCGHTFSTLAKHGNSLRQHDVIYINGPRLIPHGLALSTFTKAQLCCHIHLDHTGPERQLLRLAALHPSTKAIFTPSAYIQKRLRAYSSIFQSPKVKVLENGLGPEFDLKFRDRLTSAPLQSIVVIGRLSPEKGQDAIQNAARAMPEVSFHLLGDSDFASACFKHQLLQTMPPNVHFHGKVLNVATAIDTLQAQICVVPSRCDEAFGLSAIEGMASSCLTLVRNRGGLQEVAEVTGALTFSEDKELTSLLLKLSKSSREALAQKALEQHTATTSRYNNNTFRSRIRDQLARLAEE